MIVLQQSVLLVHYNYLPQDKVSNYNLEPFSFVFAVNMYFLQVTIFTTSEQNYTFLLIIYNLVLSRDILI